MGLIGDRSGRLDSAAAAVLLEQWLQEGPELKPVQPSRGQRGHRAFRWWILSAVFPASMRDSASGSGDVPTVLVRDGDGRDLLCFLEQLIPLDGNDYVLLTPVDTPVSLFRLQDDADPEPILALNSSEPILSVADVVLQEHDLTLVRSAVTLTVSGELDEPDPDDLDDDDEDEVTRTRRPSSCW